MPADTKVEISAALLRRLHHGHQLTAELQSQVKRAPLQLKASETRVQEFALSVDGIKEKRKNSMVSSDKKQRQLGEREDRIKELKTKLNSAASNREFSTFQEQIAADEKANEVLSDEILETLEWIDQVTEELTQAEAAHTNEQTEHDGRGKAIHERLALATENLQAAQANLAAAEADIPAAMRSDYDRLIQRKGEEALAPVEENSCGGCHQVLTTQWIDWLQLSKLVRCPNCDAFLYIN